MFILAVVSHHKNGLHRLHVFHLSHIIYTYISSGIPRPEKWGEEVQNINLIRRSGFVEAAFVCFNWWFCLLLEIPLYFHNIVKPDRRKWRQLLVG